RYQEFHAALLSSHLGDVALRQEPRPARVATARRLEVARHGDALCTRQRRRACADDRQSAVARNWGETRGHSIDESKISMTFNSIMRIARCLGKGEVVSSILTGSTSSFAIDNWCGTYGKVFPCVRMARPERSEMRRPQLRF